MHQYDFLKEWLGQTLKTLGFPAVDFNLDVPQQADHGDLSTNVALLLSKQLGLKPLEIGHRILNITPLPPEILKAEVHPGGFINFWLTDEYFALCLKSLSDDVNNFAASPDLLGHFDAVIVEYSSPNIAKPFGIGHHRSTIIGDAVANILTFHGYKVIRDNHLGDWGTQFGRLLYAITAWSSMYNIEQSKQPMKDLVDLYVRFHAEAEQNESLDVSARAWFKKLEDNDVEARDIWQKCVEISLKDFDDVYQKLNVHFDTTRGESFYEKDLSGILEELKTKKLMVESEGAQLVNLDSMGLPPLLLLKSDGATLYALRDLAADKVRFSEYGQNLLIINEVGSEQTLYFQQLFALEGLLGWCQPEQRRHLRHGMIKMGDKKMSTRAGDVVWLDEVLDKAVDKATQVNPEVANDVGIGAIKWNDLKNEAIKDIQFDWDQMLNLKGNTGPYVQYTYARACSVLSKGQGGLPTDVETFTDDEKALARSLTHLPTVLFQAGLNLAPHHLCQYLFSLSQEFNGYYERNHIIGSERESEGLMLCQATSLVLKTGLTLLGLSAPEKI